LEQHNVSAACILGTRNSFGGERNIGNYKLYYEGAGSSTIEQHAGVIVVIHSKFVSTSKVNKVPAVTHRSLAIRLKSEFIDVAIIAGYAPGDHLPRSCRIPFWTKLSQTVRKLSTEPLR